MTDAATPSRKRSLSDAVFQQLKEQIVARRLSPGTVLPAERALSESFKVNRGALREALKRLEQARLVTIQQGGATRVLDFLKTAGTDILVDLLVGAGGHIDARVVRSVMEMRSALAPDISRLCARRATKDVLAELDSSVLRMEQHEGDPAALQRDALHFWGAIVDGSDNVAYQLAFNSLRVTYDRVLDMLTEILADEVSDTARHAELARAIRARDEGQAFEVARDLMRVGEMRFVALTETLSEPVAGAPQSSETAA